MTRLTTIAQFKEYIGKTIFAVPTGNAARGKAKDYFTEFTVVSVKRKYVELQHLYYGRTGMYSPETGATQSEINAGYGGNSGYKFYSDLEAINKERITKGKLSEIRKIFQDYGRLNLNDKQIEQIHEIITQGAW